MNKKITIGLLSHYFQDTNLGCSALSICNVVMIDNVASELGVDIKYVVLVNEKQPHIELTFTDSEYEYRVFPSTKKLIKKPWYIFNTDIFADCNVVFNLCAGDGFTDIYGKWRTFSESYMVFAGARRGKRIVLSPQTIGPFSDKMCRMIAKKMLNQCSDIFVRDHLSYELCCQMGQKEKTKEVIDVALALPFEKKEFLRGKNVGINVSGLLYNDKTNRFNLSFDYREFIDEIIAFLQDKGFLIHLIPHVILNERSGEDDYLACQNVFNKHPNIVMAPMFSSPIEAKGYISGLDLFTGARMHATIAAISSGVPVIPVAYSRKVNGLYGNLKYPYYIDAKDLNDVEAISTFIQYVNDIENMKSRIEESEIIYKNYLEIYHNNLKRIVSEELEK
jgi:polysaccharide pyruvyl transferase WcaK-like protein